MQRPTDTVVFPSMSGYFRSANLHRSSSRKATASGRDRLGTRILDGKVVLQPRQPQRLNLLKPFLIDQRVERFDLLLKRLGQIEMKGLLCQPFGVGRAPAPVKEDNLLEQRMPLRFRGQQ